MTKLNESQLEVRRVGAEIMKKMGIYKPYIDEWKKNGTVTMYERFAGYWINQYPEAYAKLKEIESKGHSTVYAAVHMPTSIGDLWYFLLLPNDLTVLKNDLDQYFTSDYFTDGRYLVYCYTWNVSEPMFSEYGDVVIRPGYGGIICE